MNSTTPSLLDDIENDPLNPYENEMPHQRIYYSIMEYVLSVVHLLICIAILLSSSLFYYAFRKFGRLQTRTNRIFVHYLVCNTLASLFFTLIIILNVLMSVWHKFTYAFVWTIGLTFWFASFIFAFLLAQDWMLTVSNTRIAQKYQSYYKWMIGSVYLLLALTDVFLSLTFFAHLITAFLALFCVLFYGVAGIVIIVFNIIRYRKQISEESKQILYALNVANVYYLMWLPAISMILLNFFFMSFRATLSFPIEILLFCFIYLLEMGAFSAPVVIIWCLAKWDKNFKMACDYVFKKSLRKYEPTDNNLDEV